VILTGSIRQRAGDVGSVEVAGATAGEIVAALEELYPALRGWVTDEQGALRRHVRLFLGQHAVTLDAPVGPDHELHIIAAISGG
jgi:molybdopterin converting factor small subunit